MTAFDSDILSDLFEGVAPVVRRVSAIPVSDQYVPIVSAEELIRGQLDSVRKAQAAKALVSLESAYTHFAGTLTGLRRARFLQYTVKAHSLFVTWRAANIRISSNDLRIAAICFTHEAKLVTRNARDYIQVPGLNLDVWN